MDTNNIGSEQSQAAPQTPSSPTPPTKNTGMAILAYLGPLIVIPFLTEAHNDPFVKFHLKQALPLLVLEVVGGFIFWFPIIGWLLWLFTVVLLVMGIMNAAAGKEKELPILGQYSKYFHF
ncbi:MAG TPA: hypothetical protein VF974_03370 [Patescibacteria group bacterium]